jgi:cytidylate kinase
MDGPAGAGKSTIARALSKKLGFTYINSGGLYRCYAIALKNANTDITDINAILKIINETNVNQSGDSFFLNGVDVTKLCYSKEISSFVPLISKIPEIRVASSDTQKKIAKLANIVIEGRDTTTVMFPGATLKVYVTADPKLRAQRRWEQSGKVDSFDAILEDLLKRDELDMTRIISPLKQAPDALFLDTTGKTIDECTNFLYDKFMSIINNPKFNTQ